MLSIGMNRKLKAGNIAVFNLPSGKDVCGRECPGCYAKKAERIYKQVLPFRLRNMEATRRPGFPEAMIKEIEGLKKRPAAIRVHESGDFYGQLYADKWYEIALALPDMPFYAYTKRAGELDFAKLHALENFVLIDSCQFGPLNYGDKDFVAGLVALGAFECPASDLVSCNNGCDYCLKKLAERTGVVFHKH